MRQIDDYTKYLHAKRIIESCNSWDTVDLHMRYWISKLFKTSSEFHWLLHDCLSDQVQKLKAKMYRDKLIRERFKHE